MDCGDGDLEYLHAKRRSSHTNTKIREMMPTSKKICFWYVWCLLPWMLLSCASSVRRDHARTQPKLYEWYDDGGLGKVSIRISLPDQIAEFERDGRPIGWSYVATGKEGHGTRPGSYSIMEKIVDKYSNRYGWIEDEFGNVVNPDAKAGAKVPPGMVYMPAPMPYWMRLTSYGIGMHGGLIPEPGKPASHGCIRLPKQFVTRLFDAVELGTPVVITNEPSQRAMPAVRQQSVGYQPGFVENVAVP